MTLTEARHRAQLVKEWMERDPTRMQRAKTYHQDFFLAMYESWQDIFPLLELAEGEHNREWNR